MKLRNLIGSKSITFLQKYILRHLGFSITFCDLNFCRGFVQCLKLSPNLRKQAKDIQTALRNKNAKKALELEVKKLQTIMAMVREPEDVVKDKQDKEES